MGELSRVSERRESLTDRLKAVMKDLGPQFPGARLKLTRYDPRVYLSNGNPDAIRAWGADQRPFYRLISETETPKRFLFIGYAVVERQKLVVVRDYSEPWVGVKYGTCPRDIGELVELPGGEKELFFKVPDDVPQAARDTIVASLTDFAARNEYRIVR